MFGAPTSTSGSSLFGGPSTSGSLFGSNTATGGSLFGNSNSTGGSLFGPSGFTFNPNTASTGSVFGGSLFGDNKVPAGGSLFGSGNTSLFNAPNSLFSKPSEKKDDDEGSDDDGDDDVGKGSGSPPSYATDAVFDQKPVNLKIESRPPEKSPYTKVFNVSYSAQLIKL